MLGLFAVFLLFEKRTPRLSWTVNLWRAASALLTVAVIAFLFARAYRWIGLASPVKVLQTVMPLEVYNRYSLSFPDLFSIITGRSGALDGGTLYIAITALICACLGLGVPGTWRWFVLTITCFVLLVALVGNYSVWLVGLSAPTAEHGEGAGSHPVSLSVLFRDAGSRRPPDGT
jgi:hypothetical protein